MKQPSSMASFSASATNGYAIDLDETAARMGAAMMLDDLILAVHLTSCCYCCNCLMQIGPNITL